MTPSADTDLYRRGMDTVVAAWDEYARGTPGAEVRRSPGVAAAIFPGGPERDGYNNAILLRDLPAPDASAVVERVGMLSLELGHDQRLADVCRTMQGIRSR